MANLKGSGSNDIGLNYKSILSIGTGSNGLGTVSSTLQTVTDGDGNTTPFQLSTTKISIYGGSNRVVEFNTITGDWIGYGSSQMSPYNFSTGNFEIQADSNFNIDFRIGTNTKMFLTNSGNLGIGTPTISARLQVRGDGTNVIGLFENNAGTPALVINNDRTIAISSAGIYCYNGSEFKIQAYVANINAFSITGAGSYNYSTGSNTGKFISTTYTVNTTGGTNTVTGFLLNATETSITGTTHKLMDLQVGSVTKFNIDNQGIASGAAFTAAAYIRIGSNFFQESPSDGVLTYYNNAGSGFNRLQFGGTTNAFPAIKRNAAAIDFRLADDSGYCNVNANIFFAGSAIFHSSGYLTNNSVSYTRFNFFNTGYSIEYGASNIISASAIFELKSTTQGFLPPRMTTTERNLISSPATGLMVFDTTLDVLMVKSSTTWLTL